jgi:hypothetical protein
MCPTSNRRLNKRSNEDHNCATVVANHERDMTVLMLQTNLPQSFVEVPVRTRANASCHISKTKIGRRLIAVKQQEITLLSITASKSNRPGMLPNPNKKLIISQNSPRKLFARRQSRCTLLLQERMTESQRRKCIEPLTQIIKTKRRFKRVQAKHGIKHAPPSSNLNDNAAIKDTRPVKRPKLNFVLKGSHKSKTSANDTGPTLDEAQNELPGVERKGIHPNESKTTSTSVQMEPQDLITQEDFDPDTGNTANKRISL